jgi:hypothetical protein
MSHRTFVLLGAMPIPVGHRVEVYLLSQEGGFLRPGRQPRPDEPLVRDLETGVDYGRTWHFRAVPTSGVLSSVRCAYGAEPAEGVAIEEKLEGCVVACRVLIDGIADKQAATTTLVVAISPPVALR